MTGVMSKVVKFLILLVVVHLVEVLMIGSIWYMLDLQARKSIAVELNIEPDWASLDKYIETHFKVGMSRIEILRQAEKIGAYTIEPLFIGDQYCEKFFFNVGPFYIARGSIWWICYDKNDVVTSVWKHLPV
jgi:hypothetical protein